MRRTFALSRFFSFRRSSSAFREPIRDLRLQIETLEDRVLLTSVWDGGALFNDNWTDRQNWVGNKAPLPGDDLVFPDSIRFTDRGLNNDFPTGTDFHNITFQGEGYLIRGNRIDLTGDITYAPKSNIILNDSKLNLDIGFSSGNHRIELVSGAVERPELEFNGRLSDTGTGDIEFSGNGKVIFGGEDSNIVNTHTVIVENPSSDDKIEILLDKPDNVAAIDGPLVVGPGGEVSVGRRDVPRASLAKVGQLTPGVDIALRRGSFLEGGHLEVAEESIGALTLDGGTIFITNRESSFLGDGVGGVLTLTDTISVTGNTTVLNSGPLSKIRLNTVPSTAREIDVASGADLIIRTDLTEGNLRKLGGGRLFIFPNSGNTYGDTFVNGGTLFLGNILSGLSVNGRTFIPHDLFIRDDSLVVHNQNSNAIADSAVIHLSNGGGFIQSKGIVETIREITAADFSAILVSDANTKLTVTGDAEFAKSNLVAKSGGSATFSSLLVVDQSTTTADRALLSFNDVLMSAGRIRSFGSVGKTLLAGKLTTKVSDNPSTIEGRLELAPGDHEFLVANGAAVNDLAIDALIDEGGVNLGPAASITKNGGGRLLLTNNNTYRGTTTLAAGQLVVNGQHSLDQGEFIVNGGTLTGKGLVREVNQIGGVLAPGFGVGNFAAVESTFMGDQSRLTVQLNGPNAAQFDQLRTGEFSLGTAAHPKLDLRLGFTPNAGQQFEIVNVTGNTLLPPNQVFRDLQGNVLTEGASFQVDGLDFTISYTAGNGNDVEIVRNTPPAFRKIAITPVITEGEKVFVSGHITERNPDDTFFLDVNWGDGSPVQTFRFAPGSPRDVRIGHRYLDDPSGANDHYRVDLHWRDQFGGTNGAKLTTRVRNAAPDVIDITASLPPLHVGKPVTVQGVIADRGQNDSLKVFIQWKPNGKWQKVNLPPNSTTFTFQHTYARVGKYQVTVQVIDDDLDFAQESFELDVV